MSVLCIFPQEFTIPPAYNIPSHKGKPYIEEYMKQCKGCPTNKETKIIVLALRVTLSTSWSQPGLQFFSPSNEWVGLRIPSLLGFLFKNTLNKAVKLLVFSQPATVNSHILATGIGREKFCIFFLIYNSNIERLCVKVYRFLWLHYMMIRPAVALRSICW